MRETFHYESFQGAAIAPLIEDLGRLRITVFREFPYLYDGDFEYEKAYLNTYVESPRGCVVLLKSKGEIVGATTCLPLSDESPEFQAPFLSAGHSLDEIFYFGESIILPEFRGHGAGHEFFRLREAHAHRVGPYRYTAFCAVDRPVDHPERSPGYETLDSFWTRMGYHREPHLKCELEWKEIGEPAPTPKMLTFWLKSHPTPATDHL
jgi:GNAT superfamily N-acetyltransferase